MFYLLSLVACNPEVVPPAPPGTITDHGTKVFSVNGTEVGDRELALVYTMMKIPEASQEAFGKSGEGRHVQEEYAAATILYQKAIEAKLYEDPKIATELAFTARQILGARMRAKLAKDSVTDEAIQKFYDDNKVQFQKPEALVDQILVTDQILATDLLARLNAGEDFATLAAAHSTDPTSKDKGGDLGWIRIEDPTIGATLAAAEIGKVAGPVESRFGFHLVRVRERRDVTPIEAVREGIAAQLAKDNAAKTIDEIRTSMTIDWVTPPTVESKPLPAPGRGPGGGGAPHGPGGPGGGGAPPHGAGGPPGGGGASPHGGN